MMLIDTREHRPEPEDEGRGQVLAWVAPALGRLFPWPAIVAWLWVGCLVLSGSVGAVFTLVAMSVSFWRISKAYPAWGMTDHQQ